MTIHNQNAVPPNARQLKFGGRDIESETGLIFAIIFATAMYCVMGFPGFQIVLSPGANRASLIFSSLMVVGSAMVAGVTSQRLNRAFIIILPLAIVLVFTAIYAPSFRIAVMKLSSMLMLMGAAVALVSSRGLRSVPMVLSYMGLVLSGLSIAFLLTGIKPTYPAQGVIFNFQYGGVFDHKNALAQYSILFGISSYYCYRMSGNVLHLASALLSGSCLILSGGATSLVAGVLAVACYESVRFAKVVVLAACGIGAALPWILSVVKLDWFWELLGRTSSLSGRDVLWKYLTEKIMSSPLFGYGLTDLATVDDWQTVTSRVNSEEVIPHAHNTWLEASYYGGALATTILFFVLFFRPMTSRDFESPLAKLFLALIAAMAVDTITGLVFFKFTVPAMMLVISSIALSMSVPLRRVRVRLRTA